jgi:hypothetical protein
MLAMPSIRKPSVAMYSGGRLGTVGRRSVAVVLLFLLGWRVFGFVVTG